MDAPLRVFLNSLSLFVFEIVSLDMPLQGMNIYILHTSQNKAEVAPHNSVMTTLENDKFKVTILVVHTTRSRNIQK